MTIAPSCASALVDFGLLLRVYIQAVILITPQYLFIDKEGNKYEGGKLGGRAGLGFFCPTTRALGMSWIQMNWPNLGDPRVPSAVGFMSDLIVRERPGKLSWISQFMPPGLPGYSVMSELNPSLCIMGVHYKGVNADPCSPAGPELLTNDQPIKPALVILLISAAWQAVTYSEFIIRIMMDGSSFRQIIEFYTRSLNGETFILSLEISLYTLSYLSVLQTVLDLHVSNDFRDRASMLQVIAPSLYVDYLLLVQTGIDIRKWILDMKNEISQSRFFGDISEGFKAASEAPVPSEHTERSGMFSFSHHFSIMDGVFNNVFGDQLNIVARPALSNIYGFGVSIFQVSLDPLFRRPTDQDLRQIISKVLEILPQLIYEQSISLAASLDRDVIDMMLFITYYSFEPQITRFLEGTQRQLIGQ
ncbi:hypothetical protein VNI00_015783 [Paramarasmius palmivorus]|uniref:Uncharacterized protein n=1 Tax=Paramarasmius palmivorus TaxID=297713 RepID=A0AAW0BJG5_9AGAR